MCVEQSETSWVCVGHSERVHGTREGLFGLHSFNIWCHHLNQSTECFQEELRVFLAPLSLQKAAVWVSALQLALNTTPAPRWDLQEVEGSSGRAGHTDLADMLGLQQERGLSPCWEFSKAPEECHTASHGQEKLWGPCPPLPLSL